MPSLRSIGAGAVAAVALSTVPGVARARAPSTSARLVYDRGPGAESCASEPALRAAVAARLGYDPFFPWARDTVVAEVERTGDGFRARVVLVGDDAIEHGAREIAVHNESCAAATEAMALTISLIIDPSRMTGGPPAAPSEGTQDAAAATEPPPQPATRASPPEPEIPDNRLPATATDRRESARPSASRSLDAVAFEAGAQILAVYAPASTIGVGFAATFGIAWRALSLDIEGRFDAPVSYLNTKYQLRAESWIAAGQVVPCVHFAWAFGCAVVAAGVLQASGDVMYSTPKRAFWAAAGGRLGAQVMPFGDDLVLRAFVDVVGTFPTYTVQIDRLPIDSVPPVAGDVGLGAAWRFR
jgi:hypothetical protein